MVNDIKSNWFDQTNVWMNEQNENYERTYKTERSICLFVCFKGSQRINTKEVHESLEILRINAKSLYLACENNCSLVLNVINLIYYSNIELCL